MTAFSRRNKEARANGAAPAFSNEVVSYPFNQMGPEPTGLLQDPTTMQQEIKVVNNQLEVYISRVPLFISDG